MDEEDKYLENMFSQKVEVPESFERAIREALYSEKFYKRLKKRRRIRLITTICTALIITSGVGYGGYMIYEKVWKNPEKYTYQELQSTISQTEVTNEEKESLMSEEEAKEKVMRIVQKLGYDGEEISSIELNENKIEEISEIYYKIETKNDKGQNLNIKLNAKNGELESLQDDSILDSGVNGSSINEEEAKKALQDLFSKIEIDENEYDITYSGKENVVYKGNEKEVWNVKGNKKYNDIVNPYEELSISFVMDSGNIKVSSISNNKNGIYENNQQVVTKEEAIEIATNKEKEFTDKEIVNIEASLDIKKMNKYIFELENSVEESYNFDIENDGYEINENIVRNVWKVKVFHNLNDDLIITKTYLRDQSKEYYIDCTTGEIIGGEEIFE